MLTLPLKLRALALLMFVALAAVAPSACILLDDTPDQGYVKCGSGAFAEVCQPGTYCANPSLSSCRVGCVSNANCLADEQCVKNRETDVAGDCVPSKTPPPCCR